MNGVFRYRPGVASLVVAGIAAAAGCTTLLGDFSSGSGPDDASSDATTTDVTDASQPLDAVAADAVHDVKPDVVCTAPEFACNGACASHDTSNCEGCGNTCTGGTCTAEDGGFACACGTGETKCTSSTGSTCTTFQTDSHNCGRCGHDCLEGTCAGALCTEVTLVISPNSNWNDLDAITTDGANVYWTVNDDADAGGGAYQISTHGSSTGSIQLGATYAAWNIGVSGTSVFWTSGGGPNIVYRATVGVAGSVASPGYTVPGGSGNVDPAGIAMDPNGHDFYFVQQDNTPNETQFVECQTSPLTCTVFPVPSSLQAGLPGGVVTDGTSVFWNTSNAIDVTGAASAGAGSNMRAFEEFDGGALQPYTLFLAADTLFWSDGLGAILSSPSAAFAPVTLVSNTTVDALAVDSRYVYWSDGNSDTVNWTPRGGGSVGSAPANEPGNMTTDGTAIYWINYGDGTIRKIALP